MPKKKPVSRRMIVNTQLSPINALSQQKPYQEFSIGPDLQQSMQPLSTQAQQPSLQQNLDALQGQQQQATSPINYNDVQGIIQKVESRTPLQPQEAQQLSSYLNQLAPTPQTQQGPLAGLIANGQQGQGTQEEPYYLSPFFTTALQSNPNTPQELKQKAPTFWQELSSILAPFRKPSLVERGLAKGEVHLPGFPQNVLHTPQAAAQVRAQQQQAQQQQFQTNPNAALAALSQEGIPGQGGPTVLSPTGQQSGPIAGTFFGYSPEVYEKGLLTGYQQRASNYLLDQGLRQLQGLNQYQPNFNPIANQQLERFHTQTIPSLAERFTAMGDGQRSSAFQGALANAGRYLSNDLAAQQQQFNQQNYANRANVAGSLLNFGFAPRFENIVNPATGGLVNAIPQIAGAAAKAYLGGV